MQAKTLKRSINDIKHSRSNRFEQNICNIGKKQKCATSLKTSRKQKTCSVLCFKKRIITRQFCEQCQAIGFPKGKNYDCTKWSPKKHKRTEETKAVNASKVVRHCSFSLRLDIDKKGDPRSSKGEEKRGS